MLHLLPNEHWMPFECCLSRKLCKDLAGIVACIRLWLLQFFLFEKFKSRINLFYWGSRLKPSKWVLYPFLSLYNKSYGFTFLFFGANWFLFRVFFSLGLFLFFSARIAQSTCRRWSFTSCSTRRLLNKQYKYISFF